MTTLCLSWLCNWTEAEWYQKHMLLNLSIEGSQHDKWHFQTNTDSTLKTMEGSWMWMQLHRLPNSQLSCLSSITDEVMPVKSLWDAVSTAIICRLSLNCAFDGNQSRYFNLALVATETCRALINFLLVKLQLSKWWYMIENYINYSTEFNNWASYFSMDLYLIAWISSKVCSKPLTAFIRVLMLQQFISYEWNQFKL